MNGHAPPSHVIRLHAAWERQELAEDRSLIRATKVSLPDSIPLSPATVALCYERKFNAPTGLLENDALFLESEFLSIADSVSLNDQSLIASDRGSKVDIKQLLRSHNRLVVTMSVPESAKATSASARLLIYSSDA
jgi:hypothetical protein